MLQVQHTYTRGPVVGPCRDFGIQMGWLSSVGSKAITCLNINLILQNLIIIVKV